MKSNFWFSKRVLVTGGDGFLAANMIKNLLKKGSFVMMQWYKKHSSHLSKIAESYLG